MTRQKPFSAFAASVIFTLGISCSLPAMSKLYKWVDENGTTHYGETIPPQYADKNRAVLDNSGRIVNEQEVLSPEERREARKAREQEEANKHAEEQEALEKKRYDKALIDTYSNENEIELARNRNLQQIELRINGINANIRIANENVQNLQKEADGYINANKEVPDSLQSDLQLAQKRLEKLQKDLEKPVAEKEAMNARYDADKARYKELTGK